MNEGSSAAALRLSGLEHVRTVLGAAAERARAGGEDDAEALAEAALPLLAHADGKVRQAVADAADALPEWAFERVLAALTSDTDHYVRAAMERAARRRAGHRKARARDGEQGRVVAELLAEIEAKHGKAARRLAERAVRRGTEYFVRKLHHEASKLVTPLEFSVNRLRTEVERPEPDRSALARHVGVAWGQLRHLWSVIDRAREATAAVTPRYSDEALAPLVDEARAQLVDRLGVRAERLAFEARVDPALRLDVDRSALLQALQNFLQNAVEAYPESAPALSVVVSAQPRRAGSQTEIAITDRGVGMTAEQRAEMFIPFGSRKPGGTGVGLVIARAMVEEVHGGSLAIESARGEGTTITIVLPSRQAGRRPR